MEEPLKGLSCVVQTCVFSSRLSLLVPLKDRVVQTFVFLSRLSCVKTCHLHPTPLLLAQDLSIVNDFTVSSPQHSLVDSATFSMLLFSNNHPLSLN